VLVHAEEVGGVVLPLDLREALVVRTEGRAHAVALVGRHEVHVGAGAGEGRGGLEVVAGPADAAIVLGRRVPAAVDVHDVLGVAVGVGGVGGLRALRGSADGT